MDIHILLPLLSIIVAIALGAASPGPSFVLVARTAIAAGRPAGLAAAFGMGIGGAVFAGLALLGLIALLAQVGWLYLGLKVAGGLYLCWLAARLWRGAKQPLAVAADGATDGATGRGILRAFSVGLLTQLSNPKTAVVYAGIFAALLPAAPPPWLAILLPPAVFLVECGWYALVAIAFSAGRPRALYLNAKHWIDRAAGGVMALLGIRLVIEGVRG
ncbi:LysE family transporter [Ferrovibrio sp.]|uniref:LysE family translocator n=1 Tax=Ferrovibrio sp. TaxID=1917215 RepID=UPI00260249CB|nr:LysE family transporter [Ferrovibrio sp.]